MAVMDFLVNKMGFNSTLIAKQLSILRVSMEKVIVPRALFAQELLSRVSEDKIMAIMDFLVNKMGFDSTLIAKQSSILHWSLEKRIVPRALFVQELLSRGLINDLKLSVLFDTSEKVFLRCLLIVMRMKNQSS
ncbi:hypothetical protein DITRI_Ditri15bG0120200 [Diplodiscus trichospermus]